MVKTYEIAGCAAGCAFHSTVGGRCDMCGSALTEPQTVTGEQMRAILLGKTDRRYDAGKAAVVAWMRSRG